MTNSLAPLPLRALCRLRLIPQLHRDQPVPYVIGRPGAGPAHDEPRKPAGPRVVDLALTLAALRARSKLGAIERERLLGWIAGSRLHPPRITRAPAAPVASLRVHLPLAPVEPGALRGR